MSSGNDYPQPDPLPPPLQVFNNVNWPQVQLQGGGGGGGGGGGTTYQTVSVSLTGSTANVEFTIPDNTRTMYFEANPLDYSNSFPNLFMRLGDDTSYYTSNYGLSLNTTTTSWNFSNVTQQTGCFLYLQISNGDGIYFTTGMGTNGLNRSQFQGYLTNITTPITRLNFFISGATTFVSGDIFKMTFMIQP